MKKPASPAEKHAREVDLLRKVVHRLTVERHDYARRTKKAEQAMADWRGLCERLVKVLAAPSEDEWKARFDLLLSRIQHLDEFDPMPESPGVLPCTSSARREG